jgi:hypothetical protein
MPARPRELLAMVGLVVAADVAIWRGSDVAPGGFGAAAFFVAVPALVLLAARARRITLRLGAILAMFAAVAIRCAFAPTAGTLLLGLLGVFALAITMRSRAAFLTDVAASFGSTFVTIPQRFEAAFIGLRRRLGTAKDGPRSFALIGIPAALVATFVALFALANPLVARWIGGFTRLLSAPAPGRVVTWIFLLMGAILLVRPAIRRSTAREAAETTGDATRGALIVARNALVPLNLVFLVYNVLDAAYLWAGSPPPGVSARHYAHEGAAWLTATLALLTIVVGVMFRGALAHDARAKWARILAFVWLGQGAVLALGTFRRLAIHITTSGLSNIRIMGMFGTGVVAAGLVLVGIKLAARYKFIWLLRRQLDALVLALFAFSLMPTHLLSARINVARVMEHEYQALVHVEEQAVEVESASVLLPLLDHDDERIRRGIAALLLNERDVLREHAKTKRGWRDGDIATADTSEALEAASAKLDSVLGDVARPDAIQPFEYIRNSAIEGEIAQSEISKVKFASTRSQVQVERWLMSHGYEAAGAIAFRTLSGPPAERLEARFVITASGGGGGRRDVVLALERRSQSFEWQIVEERVTAL